MSKRRPRRKTEAVTPPAAESVPRTEAESASFRAVADYTYDWESWHGPDGRLIWVNPAVKRTTGYTVAECLAMDDYPLPIVTGADRDRVAKVFAEARESTSGENAEFGIDQRNGESRWMSLAWQPMYGNDGGYLGFRTSIRDITERRNLRNQLRLHAEHLEQLVQERTARLRQLENRQRQMEKLAALGQLAAGVAHEINNPLAGIRNAFELIKSSLSPEHEQYELLELIDREIERISGITHQMYQLYRREPQQPAEFAIERVVGEVAYLLENIARKHRVHLRCEPPSAPARVFLPEGEVKQVLFNLMSNAIQASPAGEEVTVTIGIEGPTVLVHVKDNGPGIPPEILPRIFEPFFTTKTSDPHAGMGLGLSVSANLVDAMGGRIEVTGGPTGGSIFTIILPKKIDLGPGRRDA